MSDRSRPFQDAKDAPGQIVVFQGVEYTLDEHGKSAELARAMADADRVSAEIGAEMAEATRETSPYGNPYKR